MTAGRQCCKVPVVDTVGNKWKTNVLRFPERHDSGRQGGDNVGNKAAGKVPRFRWETQYSGSHKFGHGDEKAVGNTAADKLGDKFEDTACRQDSEILLGI